MAQKIIGIDIGSYAVKIAVIESTMRRFEWVDFFSYRVPDKLPEPETIDSEEEETNTHMGEETTKISQEKNKDGADPSSSEEAPPSLLPLTVHPILMNLPVTSESVIISFPGNHVSNRLLKLPFSDRKKIKDVIYFSMEGLIPFDIEDILIDYDVLHSDKNGSRLLAHIVEKAKMRRFLEEIHTFHIEPQMIEYDASALCNLYSVLPKETIGAVAILDVGHSKTSVCFMDRGKCEAVRVIPMGGRMLTERIARELGLSFEEAEEIKHEVGLVSREAATVSGGAPKDHLQISQIIENGLTLLHQELLRTFHRFTNDFEGRPVRVYLTGGSAALKNFPEYLSELLGIDVVPLNLATQPFYQIMKPVSQGASAVGLSLALKGASSKHTSVINFRQGEFAFEAKRSEARSLIRHVSVMAIILCLLIGADFYTRYHILQEKIEKLNETTLSVFQSIAPDISFKPGNFNQNMIILDGVKDRIDKQLKVLWGDSMQPLTALEFLREFSSRIPKEITEEGEQKPLKVDVDEVELRLNELKVIMAGETDSFASVDRIVQALQQSAYIEKIDSKPERGVRDDSVKFKLTITLTSSTTNKTTSENSANPTTS